jgi:hypothetical protein
MMTSGDAATPVSQRTDYFYCFEAFFPFEYNEYIIVCCDVNISRQRNEVYYACCLEPYPDVTFVFVMRRRTLYYLFNIICPCLWLTVLSLLGFWLPPESGEKITLGITVLLAFSVFMLLIAERIPATSEFVPLIGTTLQCFSMNQFDI